MGFYAIGKPGQPVRLIIDVASDDAARQLKKDDEQVHTLNRQPTVAVMITEDGSDVVEIPLTLDQARALQWTEAKAYRRLRENSGCLTPRGLIQTDAGSRESINLAAADALRWKMSGSPREGQSTWTREWTMANDTMEQMDADDMLAVAAAVSSYLDAVHQASKKIRLDIDAAASPDAALAVDIRANYPEN